MNSRFLHLFWFFELPLWLLLCLRGFASVLSQTLLKDGWWFRECQVTVRLGLALPVNIFGVMNCVRTESPRTTCTLDFCLALATKNEQPHFYTTQQAYHMQHEPIIKRLEIWMTSIGGSQRFVFGHVLFPTSDNPQYCFLKGFSSKQSSSRCFWVCV